MMVCLGNICRSPIAEVYLKYHHPELSVYSTGLSAMVGWSADEHSIAVMNEKGIDLSQHQAQQITADLVSHSDLILVMENKQQDALVNRFQSALGKVHLIGKWNDNEEIPDPYMKDINYFRKVSSRIESGLDDWRKEIWLK